LYFRIVHTGMPKPTAAALHESSPTGLLPCLDVRSIKTRGRWIIVSWKMTLHGCLSRSATWQASYLVQRSTTESSSLRLPKKPARDLPLTVTTQYVL
jgi:hypothetical protein